MVYADIESAQLFEEYQPIPAGKLATSRVLSLEGCWLEAQVLQKTYRPDCSNIHVLINVDMPPKAVITHLEKIVSKLKDHPPTWKPHE